MTAPTPWGWMLRTAAAVGVPPEAFWRLSLKEWRTLMEETSSFQPLKRKELMRMAETWPDE